MTLVPKSLLFVNKVMVSHHDIGVETRVIGEQSHHDNDNQADCWEEGVSQVEHEHPAQLDLDLVTLLVSFRQQVGNNGSYH